jgi:uncharacterized protein YjbI with pentapeptide repeats
VTTIGKVMSTVVQGRVAKATAQEAAENTAQKVGQQAGSLGSDVLEEAARGVRRVVNGRDYHFKQGAKIKGADLSNGDLTNLDLFKAPPRWIKIIPGWQSLWGFMGLPGGTPTRLLKTNLQKAKLNSTNIDYGMLDGSNLRGADLRGNFSLAFGRARNVDGRGIKLDATTRLSQTDFTGADLRGVDFRKMEGYNMPLLRGARLDAANFTGMSVSPGDLGDVRRARIAGIHSYHGSRKIEIETNFWERPSQVAKKEGRFAEWIGRDRTGEGPAAITRPAVKP